MACQLLATFFRAQIIDTSFEEQSVELLLGPEY
jgi:hypothetical protein